MSTALSFNSGTSGGGGGGGGGTGGSNDNFANATVLSGAALSVTGTNAGATKETGQPTIAEFNTTQGNNAQAYTDTDANNSPDAGSSPSGGTARNFDFAMPLTSAPSAYRPAAVTNLFYWNNIIHDVQYQYGFDEVAGNFQVNNYGKGGLGNDSVQAEAQDGSGTNNANFSTPPDGQRPRMQMYVWTAPNPRIAPHGGLFVYTTWAVSNAFGTA